MNKRFRLAAVLAALLACVMALSGLAAATELNSNYADFKAALSAEQVQANLVYEQLLDCTTVAEMYDLIFEQDNVAMLNLFTQAQLTAAYDHALSLEGDETTQRDVAYVLLCGAGMPRAAVVDYMLSMESTEEIYGLMLDMMDYSMDKLLDFTKAEIKQLREYIAVLDPETDDVDTQDLLDTLDVLPNGSPVESAYELIAAADSLEEMWAIMSAEENAEGVDALTYAEIEKLREKANGYYCHLEFPTESETYFYNNVEALLNKLVLNKNQSDVTAYVNWSGSNNGRTVDTGTTYNINLTGNVTLNGQINVYGTLNVTTTGNFSISRANGNTFFKVYSGGKLNITGSDGKVITLQNGDGTAPAVYMTYGTLNMDYVKIYNCKNDGDANSWGGAIAFEHGAGGTINHTTIDKCVAGNGSALYFNGNSTGTITVKNSTITNCTATTGEYDGTIRTMGGTSCKLSIESCTIKNNTSGLNGGGVYWNARGTGANLTISGTADKPTVIEGNKADNGGGIFLSGSAITISNTRIKGNNAKDGGGICMQPYDVSNTSSGPGCTLTLNAGAELIGNTAVNYGGGIYMEIDGGSTSQGEKFTINVNDGALIEANNAPNGGGIAITQTTGNAEYTAGADRKYHSYVNINGGTIRNNTATSNGGAVYVNRTKYGTAAYDLNVKISGGKIYGNSAVSGGAIYVSTDTANARAKVIVSGGAVGVDGANTATSGGAIYLNNGHFEMSGGTVSKNTAANGGAVYVAKGNFTMSGGTIGGKNAGNIANERGGAAYITNGNFTMTNGTMSYNSATTENGGAVYLNGGTFDMKAGTFEYNTTPAGKGGAVCVAGTNSQFLMASGTMRNNSSALSGGAVFVSGASFTMTNGTFSTNTSGNNGGAVCLDGGNFSMTNGTFSQNTTAKSGGAVYVKNGTFTMANGSFTGNTAPNGDGGAAYVTAESGKTAAFTMTNGTFTTNSAKNGGAVYMAAGNFTMKHGTVNSNSATNGGAVYMAGASSIFKMESGQMNNNAATNGGDGGAVYAVGGKLYIGLETCNGTTADAHKALHSSCGVSGCTHPVMSGNKADDCGGGITLEQEGEIYFYCGEAEENTAKYEGTGENVFMNGGTMYLYPGAAVGEEKNPHLVIVGGKLDDTTATTVVTLKYYANNTDTSAASNEGKADQDQWMNLPEGNYFFTAPANHKFFGWTAKGPNSSAADRVVRNKGQYIQSGDPVHVLDSEASQTKVIFDGEANNTMNMYALWAPITNDITYVDGVSFAVIPQDASARPSTYEIKETSDVITINRPAKPGYILDGWYLYQNEGQNANWGYEPAYKDTSSKAYSNLELSKLQYIPATSEVLNLTIPELTFGDITLIAKYTEIEEVINYVAVVQAGSDACIVDPESETVKIATGTAVGSTAIAGEHYDFVGWYTDEDCESAVTDADGTVDGTKFTPVRESDGLYEEATFYAKFVEKKVIISYIPVGPEGLNSDGTPKATAAGSVTLKSEAVDIISGPAQGSKAEAEMPTYKFVGWYHDAECTDPVTEADWVADTVITPKAQDTDNNDQTPALYETATYYAKFDWNVANLIITKEGLNNDDSAIFEVTGVTSEGTRKWTIALQNGKSAKIADLIIQSDYTITEIGGWSVYYTMNGAKGESVKSVNGQTVTGTIQPYDSNGQNTLNTVTISNEQVDDKWLHDESCEINFAN